MEHIIKTKLAERSNIERKENTGECYKNNDGTHFYLVRDNDVLHVTDGCINTLYDNTLTSNKNKFNNTYIKITRNEFNTVLNRVVFELGYFGREYHNV